MWLTTLLTWLNAARKVTYSSRANRTSTTIMRAVRKSSALLVLAQMLVETVMTFMTVKVNALIKADSVPPDAGLVMSSRAE